MSKNKDIEKLHDKQLEKKIEIKEHAKIEKHEPKEIKEPIKEKHEIKEAKNELKEHKVEKLEHKEKPEPKELKDKTDSNSYLRPPWGPRAISSSGVATNKTFPATARFPPCA